MPRRRRLKELPEAPGQPARLRGLSFSDKSLAPSRLLWLRSPKVR